MTTREDIRAKIATQETAMLHEIAEQLATKTSPEEILVASLVDHELFDRLTDEEFDVHCQKMERLIDMVPA